MPGRSAASPSGAGTGTAAHVALVCWGFPPFRGSGAFRPLAMANELAARGAHVSVITATREPFLIRYGADEQLEKQVDPAVTVVRVPFYPERSWPLLNDWPRIRAFRPRAYAQAMARRTGEFPEKVYPPWLPRARDAVLRRHDEQPISLILGSGVPYVDLEIAVQGAAELDVPVVLDDRDSFLMDVFTGGPDRRYSERLPYWEQWSQQAAELWFVNPPIARWHQERFPAVASRIRVVENGWDQGTVRPAQPTARGRRPLQFGYVGLVPNNFPMTAVLRAWRRVQPDLPAGSGLSFIGPLGFEVGSAAWQRADEAIGRTPRARWRGHLSRTTLADAYAELDVLLLVKDGGAMVTGGKTYEYAATGLPIAALVDPSSDALRVLADHPRLHTCADLTVGSVAAALQAAAEDAWSDDGTRLAAAVAFGAPLERRRALSPHLDRLLELA